MDTEVRHCEARSAAAISNRRIPLYEIAALRSFMPLGCLRPPGAMTYYSAVY
jgi:hypothetical protein